MGGEQVCMDCGARTDENVAKHWSHDVGGEVRCPDCTTAAAPYREAECPGCAHERWEHDELGCTHSDFVGDWGEYNEWCKCNLPKTFVAVGVERSGEQ